MQRIISTYSIVAFDRSSRDLGVAVASKFFAVGAVVPYLVAGVGAIALQSFLDPSYERDIMNRLQGGDSADAALSAVVAQDDDPTVRQVGVVDASGRSATFTGEGCLGWAGGLSGEGWAVQGNMLAGSNVIEQMAAAFAGSDGELAERLVAALIAGTDAGGDARGKQAAAVRVVRPGAGFLGKGDRHVDVRVDDHSEPMAELRRLVTVQRIANLLWARAATASAQGNYGEAIQALLEAKEAAPFETNASYFLARTYALAGDNDQAANVLREMLSWQPAISSFAARDPIMKPVLERATGTAAG